MIAQTPHPGAPTEPVWSNPHIGIAHAIGPLQLKTNLLLAPVANYCDLAWRVVCREQGGLGLACTDLLSPHGLLRGNAQSLDLAATNELDSPICMQLYGGDSDILAEGAVWAVRHGADVIDINMGCPVDKVTKKDGGSKLLCAPDKTTAMASRLVQAVGRESKDRVPVTAKVRLGWDSSCLVAPELARELEKVGIAQVTVHGRTTEQKFKGEIDHADIRDVVQAVDRIPVLGNGDVITPESCITMMQKTGCTGVMIGRGSFSAPWLFDQSWKIQTTGTATPEPNEEQKVAIIRRYLDLMVEYRGKKYAMTHIRRRITWFGKKLSPCKPMKEAVRTSETPDDVHRVLDRFLEGGLRVWPAGSSQKRREAERLKRGQPL
ncbi:MAG: tRNA dihydrouridine synthase DusB [Planctomycetota bacterium]